MATVAAFLWGMKCKGTHVLIRFTCMLKEPPDGQSHIRHYDMPQSHILFLARPEFDQFIETSCSTGPPQPFMQSTKLCDVTTMHAFDTFKFQSCCAMPS